LNNENCSRVTCNNRIDFFGDNAVKKLCLSFNWSASRGVRGVYIILTFCWCGLVDFVYIYLLLRFLNANYLTAIYELSSSVFSVVDLYIIFLRYYFALLFALISKFRLFIRFSHCLFSFFNYCSSMFIYCRGYILLLLPSSSRRDALSICNTPSPLWAASLPRVKHSYFRP